MGWVVVDDVPTFIPGKPIVPASTSEGRADVVNHILDRWFSRTAMRERERASFARLTGMDWGVPDEFNWAAQARVEHPVPEPRVGEFGFRDAARARALDELVEAAVRLYQVRDLRTRAALRDRFIREMRAGHPDPQPLPLGRPTVRPQHRGGE
ncbi:hypothetical protein DM785_02475 [Deinococcus actinosclerus]|nr:hypothetical protein DM785_02475 [Deinococcus actinosclerus]